MASDALEYNDVFLVARGALNQGRLKLHKQGVVFKAQKTGRVDQIPLAEIEAANWIRVARGFGFKVVLKNGTQYKFDGFRETDYVGLQDFISKNFSMKLEEVDLCVKGWNWGTANFHGSVLSFDIDKKPAFEIPLSDVSHATTGKNEVTIEFHQHDDAEVNLMELRFFVPNTNDTADPVKEFYDQIMRKADVIQATGDAIVTFSEIACLTPRGRYSIKVYPTFLQLHGKTYDYKIPHTTILRLFLLPHKDQRFMFFVVSMDPPIRQGQTRYPFLILQFSRDEEVTVKLNLSEEDLQSKYGGKLTQDMSGSMFEIVSRVMKEIVGRKITVPGSFKGQSGSSGIHCSRRAGNGLLYPLERGFIFLHKPPIHIRFDEISTVNFARGSTTGRTFDFEVDLKNGTVVTFSNLEREEYSNLFDYVNSKKLRIGNKGTNKGSGTSLMDDLMDSDEDEHDVYLNHVKEEGRQKDDDDGGDDDDDESEDEDFDPDANEEEDVKEEYDSNASSSSEEGSDAEEQSAKKKEVKKKEKRKSEVKPKEPKAKKAKAEGGKKSKKEKKDPNAPKRPMTPYMLWLGETREKIKEDNPGISVTDLLKKAGELWKGIGDKSEWEEKGKEAKKRYEREMEEYNKKKKDLDSPPIKAKTKPSTSEKSSKSSDTVSPSKYKSKEFIDSDDDDSSSDGDDNKKKPKGKSKKESSEEEESEAQMTDESEGSGSDSD